MIEVNEMLAKSNHFLHVQLTVKETDRIKKSIVFSDGVEADVEISKKDDFFEKIISLYNNGCKIAEEMFSEPTLSTDRNISYFSDTYCVSVVTC